MLLRDFILSNTYVFIANAAQVDSFFSSQFIRIRQFKYCLINEQECFIGFKTTRRSRVVLDPIKHDLRVY